MTDEIKPKKKAESKKVSVIIMRKCKDSQGNEYQEGETAELDKE